MLRNGTIGFSFEAVQVAGPAAEAVGEAAPVGGAALEAAVRHEVLTPSVEIWGSIAGRRLIRPAPRRSSHNVPVPLNQNCSRLSLAARSVLAAEQEVELRPLRARQEHLFQPGILHWRVFDRASSTAPPLMLTAFAQNVIRYHWSRRTLTLPGWQIIA